MKNRSRSRLERSQGFCVCVSGVPGVGKTTLLVEHVNQNHFDRQITGSSIIKALIAPATVDDFDKWPSSRREIIREASINSLKSIRKECPGRLVLDGHFTLRNRSSSIVEPVFTASDKLFFDALVLVELVPERILSMRNNDTRDRIYEDVETIAHHQVLERKVALELSCEMNVPLAIIDQCELGERLKALNTFLDAVCPL